MGIRDRPTSFRSPWQNGYAERAPPAAYGAAELFFTDFDIEILHSVQAALRRTTEAPPRPSLTAGCTTDTP
jgi:hypothetical protein